MVKEMKFFSDLRLLMVSLWLGGSVYFIGAAQAAFAVLPQRELAGAVVSRDLSILNYAGMAIAAVLLLTSFVGGSRVSSFWLWVERFLLVVLASACAVGEYVIGFWLSSIRSQLGRPIDEVAAGDPLKVQFDLLHQWSVWVLVAGMAAALIAFFIIANRRFSTAAKTDDNIYDFSKEFKV